MLRGLAMPTGPGARPRVRVSIARENEGEPVRCPRCRRLVNSVVLVGPGSSSTVKCKCGQLVRAACEPDVVDGTT